LKRTFSDLTLLEYIVNMRYIFSLSLLIVSCAVKAGTGTWNSTAIGTAVTYSTSKASGTQAKDYSGKPMTVVYLENLGFQKIGQNSNAEDVAWLRSQGYQVIELDYAKHEKAVSPTINLDIISINTALSSGSFCGCTTSADRSYILMEGYRIQRDIAYYWDDPTVYNFPTDYASTPGDSLYMDLIYPANPSMSVPTLVTFSYSNSSAGDSKNNLTDANKHKRMFLGYTWGQFKDSFVEGVSAVGMAWAICDHPKYCEWGRGCKLGGGVKSYGSIEVNPDASRKVKSAIRTVRGVGKELGLNDQVAVTGFSRGSTASSLAVGDKDVAELEDASRGRFPEESSHVQCAVLGPGMFDYEHLLEGSNESNNMKTYLTDHSDANLAMQGAVYTIETNATAPVLFFYNQDDYYKDNNKNAEGLYSTQAKYMKAKLDNLGVYNETITGYSTGHAVPQNPEILKQMYDFLQKYMSTIPLKIKKVKGRRHHHRQASTDLQGRPIEDNMSGLAVNDGKIFFNL